MDQYNEVKQELKQKSTYIENFENILKKLVELNGSDIHIKVGSPIAFRINGELVLYNKDTQITEEFINDVCTNMMDTIQLSIYTENKDVDLAYSIPGVGRFRVNIFSQRNTKSISIRYISFNIPTIDSLQLPDTIKQIALKDRGLILVTGVTGSGKSTTLASMIDYINNNKASRIITIEDPIEYLHSDKKSIICQREIGMDTYKFARGLREALRQDPNVILVGEMRDMETIEFALTAAETGHLVVSTLHTSDAQETINRILTEFPPHQQRQIRSQLGSVLQAIISQRLVKRLDGNGRIAAVEILKMTETIKECIIDKDNEGLTESIIDYIKKDNSVLKSQTFDQHLLELVNSKLITVESALAEATNRNDFNLYLKTMSCYFSEIHNLFK
jgi:twitching motility protein PilT